MSDSRRMQDSCLDIKYTLYVLAWNVGILLVYTYAHLVPALMYTIIYIPSLAWFLKVSWHGDTLSSREESPKSKWVSDLAPVVIQHVSLLG